MNELNDSITKLATRAAQSETKPHEAMQLAQAALNLAQAVAILGNNLNK